MRLGLDHTDEKSVMQPAGSFYGIQEVDVATRAGRQEL